MKEYSEVSSESVYIDVISVKNVVDTEIPALFRKIKCIPIHMTLEDAVRMSLAKQKAYQPLNMTKTRFIRSQINNWEQNDSLSLQKSFRIK